VNLVFFFSLKRVKKKEKRGKNSKESGPMLGHAGFLG